MRKARIIGMLLMAVSAVSCSKTQVPYYGAFSEVGIDEIEPQGWLRTILLAQKDGLGMHREESGYPYNTCLWAGNIPKGGNPIAKGWWPYEQAGYMVDGLYRCGIFLQDSTLVALGRDNVRYVLDTPRSDGLLGPESLGDNQWALSVFFRAISAYYEETGDTKALKALENHFKALPDSLSNRQVCVIESMCKVYSKTHDAAILHEAEKIWNRFTEEYDADNSDFRPDDMISSKSIKVHGVTAAEVSKQPAILYLYTGNEKYLKESVGYYNALLRDNVLVDGIPASAEQIAPKSPEALHETCDISDFLWSYGYMLMATGDPQYGDLMESSLFNAAMGAVSKDFRSHEYFSSPNQIYATHTSSAADYGEEGLFRQAYRPGFDTECCSGNVHRMIPNYVSRMWMRNDDGIIASLYGPSVFTTCVNGVKVKVEEITDYPFDGKIVFRISTSDPVRFSFGLRIPDWASGSRVSSVGQCDTVRQGSFYYVERQFRDGDTVELSFPMTLRFARTEDGNGVNVWRGPLLMSLDIKEDAVKVVDGFKSSEEFPAWDINPASPWNYALSTDEPAHETICRVSGNPWSQASTPVAVTVKGYRVPVWTANGKTPTLPSPGFRHAEESDTLRLVPAGATRIRITTFPVCE